LPELARMAALKIHGSGAMFGFPTLSECGCEIEHLAEHLMTPEGGADIPGGHTLRPVAGMRLVVLTILVGSGAACWTIPTGRTGVEWAPTRGTMDRSLGEGFHVVSPLSGVYSVDLREQEREEVLDVLADNGLDIKMTSSIPFQLIAGQAYQLIKETGPEYYRTLIAPYVRSSARRVVGRYSPEEIYSTKCEQIEREIRAEVMRKTDGCHLKINTILIREVHAHRICLRAQSLQCLSEIGKNRRADIRATGVSEIQQCCLPLQVGGGHLCAVLADQIEVERGHEATDVPCVKYRHRVL
jgi:SPFH domain / Band 7 family